MPIITTSAPRIMHGKIYSITDRADSIDDYLLFSKVVL